MSKGIIRLTFLILVFLGAAAILFVGYSIYSFPRENASPLGDLKKLGEKFTEKVEPEEPTKIPKNKTDSFSILLLGIDRRHKSETAWRTDIMILLSANPVTKKAVLTSVPRDLWVNGGRINAIFNGGGFEEMANAFEIITGDRPLGYIQCDFEDLVWLVDSLGGVEVNLDTAFTDTEYPNDVTKTYITVSFPAGVQKVDGRTALVLSRSRHGNNGEGSDFKRMVRQHKILNALPEAILSQKSLFNPFNIDTFYEAVSQRMVTDLTLADSKVLWKFFPDRTDYAVESFLVDSEFLYNPPMADYGGAWVLVPKNLDYTPIHLALKQKLEATKPNSNEPASTTTSQ